MQVKAQLNILKETLDSFYRQYDIKQHIAYDPVEFPHRYRRAEDIEISGFIASALAYGRVKLFKPVINKILSKMGNEPYKFVLNFVPESGIHEFKGIKYRMNTTKDIVAFIYLLSMFLKRYGTPGEFFKHNFDKNEPNIINTLSRFVKAFYTQDTRPVYGTSILPFGLLQMLPSPDKGSPCKRSNMFLRWMVRQKDDVDFGLWTFIPANKLIIPLDTHIARISRHLGLTNRKTTDLKTAIEITDNLKQFDPDDPVKYDFALCHLGISGKCPAKPSPVTCLTCSLKDVCLY
ncbi:MAG: TIGR02757 family protein [bacterium]